MSNSFERNGFKEVDSSGNSFQKNGFKEVSPSGNASEPRQSDSSFSEPPRPEDSNSETQERGSGSESHLMNLMHGASLGLDRPVYGAIGAMKGEGYANSIKDFDRQRAVDKEKAGGFVSGAEEMAGGLPAYVAAGPLFPAVAAIQGAAEHSDSPMSSLGHGAASGAMAYVGGKAVDRAAGAVAKYIGGKAAGFRKQAVDAAREAYEKVVPKATEEVASVAGPSTDSSSQLTEAISPKQGGTTSTLGDTVASPGRAARAPMASPPGSVTLRPTDWKSGTTLNGGPGGRMPGESISDYADWELANMKPNPNTTDIEQLHDYLPRNGTPFSSAFNGAKTGGMAATLPAITAFTHGSPAIASKIMTGGLLGGAAKGFAGGMSPMTKEAMTSMVYRNILNKHAQQAAGVGTYSAINGVGGLLSGMNQMSPVGKTGGHDDSRQP